MAKKTFKELEREGWIERAASYEIITHVTNQAIEPILASFGKLANMDLLEVAAGPGHLAAKAATKGARVTAIDFAATMVERASASYPDVQFFEGDAEHLTFADNHFDGVICAFGLLHLEHPELAISEAFRVLKPGAQYTATVWCSPEQGGDFFGFLMQCIQQHGDLNVELPPAPPFYRFADPLEAKAAFSAVGFDDFELTTFPVVWRGTVPRDAVDVIYKATVRTKAMLDAQTADAREAIHQAIIDGMDRFRTHDHYELALPAVMLRATKPA